MSTVKRGDIFYADLSPVVGSEQGGMRPVLIVQNDTGNRHSPTVIAAAITSQTGKARLPTHIELNARSVGLSRDSVIVFLDRSLNNLVAADDRPLASRRDALERLYSQRYDIYCAAAELHINADVTPEEEADTILKELGI